MVVAGWLIMLDGGMCWIVGRLVLDRGSLDGRGDSLDGRGGSLNVRGGSLNVRGSLDVRGGSLDVRDGSLDGRGGSLNGRVAQGLLVGRLAVPLLGLARHGRRHEQGAGGRGTAGKRLQRESAAVPGGGAPLRHGA